MLTQALFLDGQALLWIQNTLRGPILDGIFAFYTSLGNAGLVWIALCVVMLCFSKTRRAGFWGLIAMLFGLFITNLGLKPLVARDRPWLVVEGLRFLVEEHDPNSFPSGHSCAAFAAGMTWFRLANAKWLKGICLGQALLMAFSRLYVGVHFPSDVIVGSLVGCLCAYLAYRVEKIIINRKGLSK